MDMPGLTSAEARARLVADAVRFTDLVTRITSPHGMLRDYFDPALPIVVSRAPGRLDVMGGIADYSGSLALELPLADATLVAAQPANDGAVRIASIGADDAPPRVAEVKRGGLGLDYERVRAQLGDGSAPSWAGYVAGCITSLKHEVGVDAAPGGARLIVASNVPEGSGVSSSAALTVATVSALLGVAGAAVEAGRLALICQKVENLIVGAPSGVMDPMAVVLGEDGCLLELLCQPATVLGSIPIPRQLEFIGLDSRVRHEVTGDDYRTVRIAAFMGYRIIAERSGLTPRTENGRTTFEDDRFGGYLANVDQAVLRREYLAALPETLLGEEFMARYGTTTDRVTSIDPRRSYPVRAATVHPIEEHARARRFASLLRAPLDRSSLEELGKLMVAAHRSYGACGLGSSGTDRLVELVQEAGAEAGFYGAKITGGGSGGTVAVLARAGATGSEPGSVLGGILARYQEETGLTARIFRGSSAGSARFGALCLLPGPPHETKRLEVVR